MHFLILQIKILITNSNVIELIFLKIKKCTLSLMKKLKFYP